MTRRRSGLLKALALIAVPVSLLAAAPRDPSDAGANSDKRESLTIVSTPPGAVVTLDGVFAGIAPVRMDAVEVGRHEIEVSLPGYRPHRETIHVEEGKASLVQATLDPLPGKLDVTVAQKGAEIRVDGGIKGETRWSGKVEAGTHLVQAALPGWVPYQERILVAPGGAVKLDIELDVGSIIEVPDVETKYYRDQDRMFEWPSTTPYVGRDGAPMVLVPAGAFTRGSPEEDKQAYRSEKPPRTITLEAFFIDKYEVPQALYRQFLDDPNMSSHKLCHPAEPEGKDHRPGELAMHGVEWNQSWMPESGVDWFDAYAYCAWAGKRLPTEAEWEKAARGTDGRMYPWGDEPPGAFPQGNFADVSFRMREKDWTWIVEGYNDSHAYLSPIGRFPRGASPYGAEDMAGNVMEWVADYYDARYYATSPAVNPRGPAAGQRRVMRGGSWNDSDWALRAANRLHFLPGLRATMFGFRCAMDAD